MHFLQLIVTDYMRQSVGGGGTSNYPPRSGYDELDTTLMPPRPGEHYGRGASPATAGSGGSAGGGSSVGMNQQGHPVNPHPNYGGPGGKLTV